MGPPFASVARLPLILPMFPVSTSAIITLGPGYVISRGGSAGRTSLEGVGYHSSASPDVSPGVKSGYLHRMGSTSVAVRRSLGNGARRADQQPSDPGVPRLDRRTPATQAQASSRRTGRPGSGVQRPAGDGSPNPTAFIPGQKPASPSPTRGGSRTPESGTYGSLRGALGNERPCRVLR
jgi:hypothetical protein